MSTTDAALYSGLALLAWHYSGVPAAGATLVVAAVAVSLLLSGGEQR